jgi:tetratricopeptide (TPR) repeat protein
MQDADVHAVALLDRIQAAYDQAHTPAAEQAAQLTESTVQLTDRGTIESAIKDLNTAISLYPGNYTAVERKEIDNELARLADLLSKLDALEAVQDMINNLPTNAQPGDTAAKDAYDAAKEAYDQLGSREKAQINTEKLDALAGMLKAYAIIEGMDGVWVKESELETGLGFLANGPQAALSQILIDTTVLTADSYTVSAPSTTLTLNVDYLESLDAGVYKLTVRYADGEASCFFTVEEAPAKSFGWIWIILLILIALIGSGILCYVLYNKKEQKAAKE